MASNRQPGSSVPLAAAGEDQSLLAQLDLFHGLADARALVAQAEEIEKLTPLIWNGVARQADTVYCPWCGSRGKGRCA